MRKTTMEVLERLEMDRDTLATHPEHIQIVVRDLITPHFDFNTMTRLALGDYWKNISESRHSCLISGFRNLLVERYADILLGYNNQMITYEAVGPVGKRDFVKIRQTITRDGARPLPI
ncbi:MAG TPA: ABC transporter substrate-binding protein, partial [Gammaproteobacteria bacterium]|nr:ABC transporter substrate-binding protein [Gammaproteobacteria bacterium]